MGTDGVKEIGSTGVLPHKWVHAHLCARVVDQVVDNQQVKAIVRLSMHKMFHKENCSLILFQAQTRQQPNLIKRLLNFFQLKGLILPPEKVSFWQNLCQMFYLVKLLLLKDRFHELNDILKDRNDRWEVSIDYVLAIGLLWGKVSSSSVASVEEALVFLLLLRFLWRCQVQNKVYTVFYLLKTWWYVGRLWRAKVYDRFEGFVAVDQEAFDYLWVLCL